MDVSVVSTCPGLKWFVQELWVSRRTRRNKDKPKILWIKTCQVSS
jgi:hypothetical protein